MADQKITDLTDLPAFDSTYYIELGKTGFSKKQLLSVLQTTWQDYSKANEVIPISCTAAAVNLADSTTYYFSDTPTLPPGATATSRKLKLPSNSTLYAARIETIVGGTLAAGDESSTLSIRLNNTTDSTISSAVKFTTAAQTLMITGLNVSVATTDDFQMKLVTPAFSTNPTTCYIAVTLFLN